MTTSKQKRIEDLKLAISLDRETLERAIVFIYNLQTGEEQLNQQTVEKNNIGFSGVDAKRFSYYARYIMSGKHLTGKHLELARKRMPKYARQIIEMTDKRNING